MNWLRRNEPYLVLVPDCPLRGGAVGIGVREPDGTWLIEGRDRGTTSEIMAACPGARFFSCDDLIARLWLERT